VGYNESETDTVDEAAIVDVMVVTVRLQEASGKIREVDLALGLRRDGKTELLGQADRNVKRWENEG